MENSNSIFRKTALDRISSPEQLNEYIKITNPGVWVVLLGCMALLIAVGFWSVFGSIPDSVQVKGVVFPQNGVTALIPETGGRISDVRVKVGDFVQAGQIIAVVPQEDLIQEINNLGTQANLDISKINALRSEYERKSLIVAPVSGIVLNVMGVHETASSNQALASIVKQEKFANDKQIITYVPSSTAKKLREGMEVQASPSFAPREEYGYMYGYITSIGTYPVTEANVLSALGSEQYAVGVLPEGSCVEVRITLTPDPDSADKIKWSNQKGEGISLSIGTNCNLLIVTKKIKPYELIF
ncbi:biotin/lipoyl-binding protein [Desulfosporosinus lacus]|uniref:Biotin-lipoyl like n=1 Tax=Desulfosporosinus lacus DSM 15449 TaxID=1121420 RepID=A0A1M5QWX4_9FIRM|nr:biotin/lipoyl-binding protein [Desulfosporosinus lacus]SHH18421.1 Biotin-lipoyl like [Desulfosporosinus lacus DSM 15449]